MGERKHRTSVPSRTKKEFREYTHDNRCPYCGQYFMILHIHHIDCDPTNHRKSNLIPLCEKCHWAFHIQLREMKEEYRYKVNNFLKQIVRKNLKKVKH